MEYASKGRKRRRLMHELPAWFSLLCALLTFSQTCQAQAPNQSLPSSPGEAHPTSDRLNQDDGSSPAAVPAATAPSHSTAPETTVQPATVPEPTAIPPRDANSPFGNDRCLHMLGALSGTNISAELVDLLKGVVRISRKESSIELQTADNAIFEIGLNTAFGEHLLDEIAGVKSRVGERLGQPAADIIDTLSGINLTGDRVEIERSGPDEVVLDLNNEKPAEGFRVKELRLRQMSFTLDYGDNRLGIKNIEGIRAVIGHGFDWPVDLKELSMTFNDEGSRVFTVGIKNPLPRVWRDLFGAMDILHFSFTNRGNHNQQPPDREKDAHFVPQAYRTDLLK